jgi:hypothetical protein
LERAVRGGELERGREGEREKGGGGEREGGRGEEGERRREEREGERERGREKERRRRRRRRDGRTERERKVQRGQRRPRWIPQRDGRGPRGRRKERGYHDTSKLSTVLDLCLLLLCPPKTYILNDPSFAVRGLFALWLPLPSPPLPPLRMRRGYGKRWAWAVPGVAGDDASDDTIPINARIRTICTMIKTHRCPHASKQDACRSWWSKPACFLKIRTCSLSLATDH